MTLQEIANHYKTTKTRVGKWFDVLDIPKNKQGGGNNRKVIDAVSHDTLKKYVDDGFTNAEICEKIGCSKSNVARLLRIYDIKRDYRKSEYDKYCRKVRNLTEKKYVEHIDIINPERYPRTLCGVSGGYQVDHIKSVRECFDKGFSVEFCASIENLQMITWEENLKRRRFIKNGKRK